MKISNFNDVLPVVLDNAHIKNVAGRVLIGKEDGADNFCMRVFEMGKDGHTPRHTHPWEHEIFVHKGHGDVFIENKWYTLSPGSAVFIPANIEHQFKNPLDETFIFVCLVPSGAPEI